MPPGERLSEINMLRSEQLRAAQLLNYEVVKSGCWFWQGGTSPDGYGKVKRFGKTIRAHRLFYEHHVEPVPEGLWVLHKCDNPLCVNPDHLWVGTQLDNEQDKDAKGRRPEPKNTLRLNHAGEVKTLSELEKESGLSKKVIGNRLRRGWDLNAAVTKPIKQEGDIPGNAKLSATDAVEIYNSTDPAAVIAAQYRVHEMHVHRIRRGERWSSTTKK